MQGGRESYAFRATNATAAVHPVLSRFWRKSARPLQPFHPRRTLVAHQNESRYRPRSVGV
jgi:hypothetical protein